MPDAIEVRKIPLHTVSDASELGRLIDDGVFEADRVIAVIGKTEGNGGVNDYTRIIADRAFREMLVAKGADPEKVKEVPIVWSGGTDGVISPHATVFATLPADKAEQTDEPRLTRWVRRRHRAVTSGRSASASSPGWLRVCCAVIPGPRPQPRPADSRSARARTRSARAAAASPRPGSAAG